MTIKKSINEWYNQGALSKWEWEDLDEMWNHIDKEFELEDVKKVFNCLQVAKRKSGSFPAEFPREREAIDSVIFFSPWWNNNCAIVISDKSDRYGSRDLSTPTASIWIVVYYPEEDNLQVVKFPEDFVFDRALRKVYHSLLNELNEDNPICSVTNDLIQSIIMNHEDVKELPVSLSNPTSYYIKPLDIIEVVNGDSIPPISHAVVYLGKDKNGGEHKVAQVTRNPNKAWIGNWEDMLGFKGKNSTLIRRYRPTIPHKRSELIKEQIARAVSSTNYVGAYSALSKSDSDCTKGNCQNFVSRCVLGINCSSQGDLWRFRHNYDMFEKELNRPLRDEIRKIDNHFNNLNISSQNSLNNNRQLVNEYVAQIVYDIPPIWQHKWSEKVPMSAHANCKLQ